jgi:predicted regulator of Ras-like GTPase activity (Roadblock/LC7/MglB family)
MREEGLETDALADQARLAQILKEMNGEGSFIASALVGSDGMPLSAAPGDFDAEALAATATSLKGAVQRSSNLLGLDEWEEISLVQGGGMRLVCRYFAIGDEELILAVVVGSGRSYRRLTNRAIKKIRTEWEGFSWVGS